MIFHCRASQQGLLLVPLLRFLILQASMNGFLRVWGHSSIHQFRSLYNMFFYPKCLRRQTQTSVLQTVQSDDSVGVFPCYVATVYSSSTTLERGRCATLLNGMILLASQSKTISSIFIFFHFQQADSNKQQRSWREAGGKRSPVPLLLICFS